MSFFYVPHFQEYWEKPIYSSRVQGRSQAKARKGLSVHGKTYIPDHDQKWKPYAESFIRLPTASISGTDLSQGTRSQPLIYWRWEALK